MHQIIDYYAAKIAVEQVAREQFAPEHEAAPATTTEPLSAKLAALWAQRPRLARRPGQRRTLREARPMDGTL